MKKENIAVIFGGKSTEHDISIITGLQTLSNVDRTKYSVIPIYISKSGDFYTGSVLEKISTYSESLEENKEVQKAFIFPRENALFTAKNTKNKSRLKIKKICDISCAIVCCHGINGEDGTLQGLLELSNIPYTSSGVLASAISMDKIVMKDVFVANQIKTSEYTYFNRGDYILDKDAVLDNIERLLSYPIFIKPSNLGSSIGISKCMCIEDLKRGIDIAINYDSRILAERGIEENIEVNCAVLGNVDYQVASRVEYPESWGDFLSFDEKYIQRNKDSKLEAETQKDRIKSEKPREKLSAVLEDEVKEIAKKAFKVFNCSGIVRVDSLVCKQSNEIYLNEINTIPGSLAFYLFKDIGYDFKGLLNRLIDIAKKEKNRKEKNKLSYESFALMNFKEGQKLNK